MTARYTAPRATINGQPAHTRRTERLRQPDKPSVRFIGDPVDEPARSPVPPNWFSIALIVMVLGFIAWEFF